MDPAEGKQQQLPRATVGKLLRASVPGDMRCSPETREAVGACLVEFLLLVTQQANDVATREHKKTLLPQHVAGALEQLGFAAYAPVARDAAARHKEAVSELPSRRARRKLSEPGVSEEDLLRQQQEFFAQARIAYEQAMQQQQQQIPQ